jgi:hypothetical protein
MMSRAFPQELERTLSCEGIALRSQPSRNIRALDRLLQHGPKLFKIPQLARAPGHSGPLPVLHGSQAHTKGMASSVWVNPKCSRNCRARLAEDALPFSEPEDLEWRSIEAAAVFASNTTLV